jgi:hypothetical protein
VPDNWMVQTEHHDEVITARVFHSCYSNGRFYVTFYQKHLFGVTAGTSRSRPTNSQTFSMTSTTLINLQKKNGMSSTDYSVHCYVCGYIVLFS